MVFNSMSQASDTSVYSSTSPTSPQAYTPSSGSDRSDFTQSRAEPTTASDTIEDVDDDPDRPLPSIEGHDNTSQTIGSNESLLAGSSLPSFSISPPPSGSPRTPTSPSSSISGRRSPSGHTVDDLRGRIARIRLLTAFNSIENSTRAISTGVHMNAHGSGSSTSDGRDDATYTDLNGIANAIEHLTMGTPLTGQDSIGTGYGRRPSLDNRSAGSRQLEDLEDHNENESTSHSVNSRHLSAQRRRSGSTISPSAHNVADEEPPNELFHDPAFQRTFENSKALVTSLSQVLGSSSLHNERSSTIRRLYNEALELSGFQCPSKRTVAFVGDSGVGKSSLINSLLDIRTLARASNSGTACTCVVTEFHYHDRNDYEIEIEYFSMDEFKDQIIELLQAYRRFCLRDFNSDDGGSGFEEQHNIARDMFRAAFGDRLTQNDGFLIEWPEENVVETLLTWTRELGSPLMEKADGIQRTETVSNDEECSRRLLDLTSEPQLGQPSAKWPFIRKIRVYLRTIILSRGLILVDLPGLRDLNSARLRITERYMLECDEIFAVCNIGRAISDVGVTEVFNLGRRAKLSNIGIICTKSDDIRADEAEGDWSRRAAAFISRKREEIAEVQEEIEQISEVLINANMIDEDEEVRLYRERTMKEKLKRAREFELKKYLVETRNQKVTNALRQHYGPQMSGHNLKVFCVSNSDYWEYRARSADVAQPFIYLSNIPRFRRHCVSIVAQSQLCVAKEYMEEKIPALLGSIELWVQSGAGDITTERRQSIRNCVRDIELEFQKLTLPDCPINDIVGPFEQNFDQQVSQIMTQRTSRWSRAAKDASFEWHGWHHSSYSAFCRHYGNHYTKAVKGHCWNDEAMEAMSTYMETPWQRLCQSFQLTHDENSRLIKAAFHTATSLTSNRISIESRTTLANTLRHRRHLLLSEFGKLFNDFEDGLQTLETDAFSGIRTSIMGRLMEDSYRAANGESGGGSDQRRKAIIEKRFGDQALFRTIRQQLKNRCLNLAANFENKVQEAVNSHFAVIRNDLDILKNQNAAVEAESDPEFRRRVEAEVGRVRREMECLRSMAPR